MKTQGIISLSVVFFMAAVVVLATPAEALDVSVLDHQKISDIEGNFLATLDDNDLLGISTASIGDFDGDGVTDVAVGARGDDDGGESRGAVWILFLNSDGTVKTHQKISSTEGSFTGVLDNWDFFGRSGCFLGDLDGDGVGDIAAGAPGDDDGAVDSGAVWILFLNSDGTVKTHQKISNTEGNFTGTLDNGDYFGMSLAPLGDLDVDGVGDIAVGAHWDDDGGHRRGSVWILFLNTDGTVKSHQKISDTQGNFTGTLDDVDHFGTSVAALGDLDGDGTIDIAVGSFWDNDGGSDKGAVWILFLNANGMVKSHQKISATQGNFTGVLNNDDEFGVSVASLGDLDSDGATDIAVGAGEDDDGGANRGAVWILFLNADGTVKEHCKISDTEGNFTGILDNHDQFGFSLTLLDDMDGDYVPDLAVGACLDDDGGPNRGAVWILFLDMDLLEVAANKIEMAIGEKEDALAEIEAALQQEREVMEILDVLLEMEDYAEPRRRAILRAKIDIRLAMVRERVSKMLLARSIRDLERSLELLSDEVPEETGLQPSRGRRYGRSRWPRY